MVTGTPACNAVPVAEMFRRVVAAVPAADERQVELDLLPQPLAVDGDPEQVARLLVNLLENALRHTPPEGWVTLGAREAGGMVADLEKHLVARGLKLIAPPVGARFAVDEVILGGKGEPEVVVAGGTEHVGRPGKTAQPLPVGNSHSGSTRTSSPFST